MTVVKTQEVPVSINMIIDTLDDGSFRGYPEHAEHLTFSGRDKYEVAMKILNVTASYLDLDDELEDIDFV